MWSAKPCVVYGQHWNCELCVHQSWAPIGQVQTQNKRHEGCETLLYPSHVLYSYTRVLNYSWYVASCSGTRFAECICCILAASQTERNLHRYFPYPFTCSCPFPLCTGLIWLDRVGVALHKPQSRSCHLLINSAHQPLLYEKLHL